ncbi:RDD family protein [Leptolyngbya sp. 7M]|uniref:RDD family protein n=1 Tax=Leptolyngbya sp. 7M TaxID=2812896 RepID=UPI001B8C0567|nr:RDD family protein [Leptolyngbya sp. 7M]QYO66174.1 RDD family protein [Leptolyngbya sp. 7M]
MDRQFISTEETLVVETPERVPIELPMASIGNRFLAVLVDHLIQYAAIALILILFSLSLGEGLWSEIEFAETTRTGLSNWMLAILILVVFAVFTGYFIFFEWLWNGQTPGKRLMRLRVIRDDGRPLTLWEAIARNLIRIFDAVPGFVVPIYSVGLITIFLNRRDQRVGDLFAGTVVIRERTDEAPTFAETFSNPVADAALRRVQKRTEFSADLSKLTEKEIEVVENLLRRRWDLDERQREWMAWRVALPLMYRLKPDYDEKTFTYEGFLEELIHKYQVRNRHLN